MQIVTLAVRTPKIFQDIKYLVRTSVSVVEVGDKYVSVGHASPLTRTFPSQIQGALKLSSVCLASDVSRAIGTDMTGVVVVVGEICDLLYGSEVWASCEVQLQSDDAQNFSFSLEKIGRSPSLVTPAAISAEAGAPGPRNPRLS